VKLLPIIVAGVVGFVIGGVVVGSLMGRREGGVAVFGN